MIEDGKNLYYTRHDWHTSICKEHLINIKCKTVMKSNLLRREMRCVHFRLNMLMFVCFILPDRICMEGS